MTRDGPGSIPWEVVALDASTGKEVTAFPIPFPWFVDQMRVTSDAHKIFVFTTPWIRSFDITTGVQTAVSPEINLTSPTYPAFSRFVLDETRGLVLVPHRATGLGHARHLLGLDASTLELIGFGNPGDYQNVDIFQPLAGRGAAAAYVLTTVSNASDSGCAVWVDALDGFGALRSRVNVRQRAGLPDPPGSGCVAGAAVLSPPDTPSDLTTTVAGSRVTASWTNPGNTSAFELEAGSVPGRRDITLRVGVVTEFVVDNVPAGVYYLRVRAINEIGASPVSNEVRVVVPSAPTPP